MKIILISFGALFLLGAILLFFGILKAPMGYEDKKGFHFGKEKN